MGSELLILYKHWSKIDPYIIRNSEYLVKKFISILNTVLTNENNQALANKEFSRIPIIGKTNRVISNSIMITVLLNKVLLTL